MPLSRVTIWTAFQVLTAAAQNAEFNNVVDFVNTLETSLSSAEGDITTLQGEMITAQDDINTAEADIVALEADVTPTALTRIVVIKVIADATALTTGDGKTYFTVPAELNGMDLVSVGAHVYTVSSSGTPTVQIYNLTQSVDMLTTRVTIDANEKDSKDATAAAVIDTANDDVATGDEIRIDVDVAGTGTAGLEVRLGFRLP